MRRVDKRGGGDWGIKGGQLRIQGELKGSLRVVKRKREDDGKREVLGRSSLFLKEDKEVLNCRSESLPVLKILDWISAIMVQRVG